MDYIITILYVLFFLLIISRIKKNTQSPFGRYTFEGIFILKAALGFFLYWLYTYYYPIRVDADIYKYFDDGRILYEIAKQDFPAYLNALFNSELPEYVQPAFQNWFRPGSFNVVNTNLTMIKIHSILFFISGGVYHVHSLVFCFASFIGFFLLYKTLLNSFSNLQPKLLILSFIIPSFILWSSAPLKEALVCFNLFIAISLLIKLKSGFNLKYALLLVLFSILTLYSKPYFLIGFVGLTPFYFWKSKKPSRKYVLFLICSLAFLFISNIVLKHNVVQMIVNKQNDFINQVSVIKSGSMMYLPRMNGDFLDFILIAPIALFNTLSQPFLWESTNPLFIFSAIENILIITSIVFAFLFRNKNIEKKTLDFILFTSVFILVEYTLIGLTTPVIGAIVRYKSPLLPLILIACLLTIDFEKIKHYVIKKRS